MLWYADVVELVDSLDLGAVTSVKVFPSRGHCDHVGAVINRPRSKISRIRRTPMRIRKVCRRAINVYSVVT